MGERKKLWQMAKVFTMRTLTAIQIDTLIREFIPAKISGFKAFFYDYVRSDIKSEILKTTEEYQSLPLKQKNYYESIILPSHELLSKLAISTVW